MAHNHIDCLDILGHVLQASRLSSGAKIVSAQHRCIQQLQVREMKGIEHFVARNGRDGVGFVIEGIQDEAHIHNSVYGKNSEIVIAGQYIAVVHFRVLCDLSTG